MLLSLILALSPSHPFRPQGFYGRQARAWFLNQVARYAPELAEAIHTSSGRRPYTVSSLAFADAAGRPLNGHSLITARDLCFLRITSLFEPLSEVLLAKVLPHLPTTMKLKGTTFKLHGRADWNEWDRQMTFEELVEAATVAAATRAKLDGITLEFVSPTAFRSEGIDLTLPTADQVWRSLFSRWQSFAGEEFALNPLWSPFADTCIAVSEFNLQSGKVIFKDGEKGAATGCLGQATYRLLPPRYCGTLAEYREGAGPVLQLLADFALFSGVGHHTTIGLGQVRRVAAATAGGSDGRPVTPFYRHTEMG